MSSSKTTRKISPEMKARFHLTPKQNEARELVGNPELQSLLLVGGSRSGKTAFLCYAIIMRALTAKSRHAILRYHFSDVKHSIGKDTMPKILDLIQNKKRTSSVYELDRTDWVFYIHGTDPETGEQFTSEIWLGGLDDKERVEKILGNEYSTIYLNEASQISYHAYTTAMTRLAENVPKLNRKCFIDCNPPEKSHWLYQMFVQKKTPGTMQALKHPERYAMLSMNPADNPHLPSDYRETLEALPDRDRRRFLLGEWLDKRQGSIFAATDIEKFRVDTAPSYLPYAVVGIDPAISSGENADETGIISVGRDPAGEYYVLRDDSLKGTPAEWAMKVNAAYTALQLGGAVYETNQGGEMVEHTIKTANQLIPCYGVHATRGKVLRAEPVAALYEEGKVHHVGNFPELEEQMTGWAPDDPKSPDRMDALIWAITYMMTKPVHSGIQPTYPCASMAYHESKYSFGRVEHPRPPQFDRGWHRWR